VTEEPHGWRGTLLDHAVCLLGAAHAGQILCTEATAALLRQSEAPREGAAPSLAELGRYRLRAEGPPERLFQIGGQPEPGPPLPPLHARPACTPSLPLYHSRFFGREEELRELRSLLVPPAHPHACLLVLTGPPGSGKTRLAVEAARERVEPYAGAVWFVPLQDLADPHLLLEEVARAVGLARSPHPDLLQQVAEALSEQPSLLVLDSFEQLLPEGGRILGDLLERVPNLSCLVTSRRLLLLEGERERFVLPLPVPGEQDAPDDLIRSPSVQLFLDRAQARAPDFQITPANAPAVAALCRRLEGIPLALELAAARGRVATPAQMLDQMERRLEFLVTRRRNVPARHQSLRAALEWSHQLLSPELQQLFAGLSVFAGGWTLPAAQAVCSGVQVSRDSGVQAGGDPVIEPLAESTAGGRWSSVVGGRSSVPEHLNTRTPEHLNPAAVLSHLQTLREASLILVDEEEEEVRFRMLDTLREFAGEKLAAAGETGAVRWRHARWYLALAEVVRAQHLRLPLPDPLPPGLLPAGAPPRGWLHWRDQEHENLRAALEWLLQERQQASGDGSRDGGAVAGTGHEALRLALALRDVWKGNYWSERREALERALEQSPEAPPHLRLTAMLYAGDLAGQQADHAAAEEFGQKSLDASRQDGDREGEARALGILARARLERGDLPAARALHDQGLALKQELGNLGGAAWSFYYLGDVARRAGDAPEARASFERGLALFREMEDEEGIAWALHGLGCERFDRGDLAGARPLFEQSLTRFRSLDNRWDIGQALRSLGELSAREGDFSQARAYLREGLELVRRSGDRSGTFASLRLLGNVALDEGDPTEARALFQQAMPMLSPSGDTRPWRDLLHSLARLAASEKQWERTATLLAAAEAISLGPEDAPPAAASEARAALHPEIAATRVGLGEAPFLAAWAQGQEMTPAQAALLGLAEDSPAGTCTS
jgi:predicted ATPase